MSIASYIKEEALCELESQILQVEGIHTIHLYIDAIGHLVLSMLVVKKECRKQGIGTKIMQMICDYADKNSLVIGLTPADRHKDNGTTSRERLIRFYSRFGFYRNKGRNRNYRTMNAMLRWPHD